MALKQVIFTYNISEIKLGGIGCSTTLPDSCVGQNTVCPSGTCVCETGYYDSDGDGGSGTCLASKYRRRLVDGLVQYGCNSVLQNFTGETKTDFCKTERRINCPLQVIIL